MNLPNKLTVLRMCLIPVFLVLFFALEIPGNFLLALLVFLVASFTDLADGKIARSRGLVTDFGKLMDPLADKLLVMSALICFVAVRVAAPVMVVLILAREFLVTAIRQLAAANGKVLAADYWGKAKTVCQMVWISYGLLYLELMAGSALSLQGEIYQTVYGIMHPINMALQIAVVALTVLSGLRYLIQNRSLLADA